MASSDDIARVRALASVDEDDERFGDEYVEALLVEEGSIKAAAATIWSIKAAEYAELVDVTESGSTRKMSDLYKNALAMKTALLTDTGSGSGGGTTAGRPRTRAIVRPTAS